jgi:hypothetical protein
MRLTAPSSRSTVDQRREQSRRRRVGAGTLAVSFPDLAQLRIQLKFEDASDRPPTGQVHDLYPSAPAFFEFACPYGDCDGIFDLREAVASMFAAAAHQGSGAMACPGCRTGPAVARQPCGLRAVYTISARRHA